MIIQQGCTTIFDIFLNLLLYLYPLSVTIRVTTKKKCFSHSHVLYILKVNCLLKFELYFLYRVSFML